VESAGAAMPVEVSVNAADGDTADSVYLTVRGHPPKPVTTARSAAAIASMGSQHLIGR
jgi:hypothetical protein